MINHQIICKSGPGRLCFRLLIRLLSVCHFWTATGVFLCDSVSKPFPLSLLKHGAACSNDLYRSKNRIFCVHSSGSARGRKLPPYGWTSKNYVICVCFHCHGTSSYHTTNTKPYKFPMHCSKRVSFWGTSYSRPPIDPYLFPRYKILAAPLVHSLHAHLPFIRARFTVGRVAKYCDDRVYIISLFCWTGCVGMGMCCEKRIGWRNAWSMKLRVQDQGEDQRGPGNWKEVVREDCQARKLNKEDAVDRCKWRKVIKEVRWPGWVW